jgi:predicted RNA-binding Zn-ribbon protein involved in translation (DUF1610 family)
MVKFLIFSLIVIWIIDWLFKGQKSKRKNYLIKSSPHGTVRIKSKELPIHEQKFHQAGDDDPSVKLKNDIINPECPYCHHKLIKSPARKTKCPYCGQFIYVRKRPKDKIRVLVTKDEADKIDVEWSIIYEDDFFDSFIKKEDMESERKVLRERFGKEPSIYDVAWGVLGKQAFEYAKNGDWGLYRNTHCLRAEVLEKESKLKEALQEYLLVCFLDLNGPTNLSLNINNLNKFPDLQQRYPPFRPEEAGELAIGIVNAIRDISKDHSLNLDEIKCQFLEQGELWKTAEMPLSPIDCWAKLGKKLA